MNNEVQNYDYHTVDAVYPNDAFIKNTTMINWESSDQLKTIKEIYGKNLTNDEFTTFVNIGKATGLNPFLRELWAVKYGNSPASIFIGRDGYRKSAHRHPLYDYHTVDAVYSNDTFDIHNGEVTHKYNLKDRGILMGAYCIIQRKGSSRPIYNFVDVKEYNKGQSVWKEKPATMIKKVAEAQGIRMGFQELFAGTYSEYEIDNDSKAARVSIATDKVKNLIVGKCEKPNIIESKSEHQDQKFNIETGEISEENIDQNSPTFEDILNQIKNAKSVDDLIVAIDVGKSISLSDEQKKVLNEKYKEKQKVVKG